MEPLPQTLEVVGLPPHIESWSVAKIPGFVLAVFDRWQRNRVELPRQFSVLMCPQVEVNAAGGLPERVVELTDPKLRCRHFTGCHKPYLVAIFTGPEAEQRRAEAQAWLAWSEGYRAELAANAVKLVFADATEESPRQSAEAPAPRTFQDLLASGELISILA
jgi:hypothetical protein